MLCTTCKRSTLEPKEVEPGLIGAACSDCNGVLLPLMNYRFWIDRRSTQAPTEAPAEISELPLDHTDARQCPKCARLMTKYQVGLKAINKIDLCGACDEAWLDSGEWELLNQLDLQDKLPRIFTDAWQRNIRKERQLSLQKDRYELLLGADDFARIEGFRSWLSQHHHREQIKLFLNYSPD